MEDREKGLRGFPNNSNDVKYLLSVIDSLRADNSKMKKRLELAEKYLGEQGLSLDAYIKFHSEE